MPKSLVERQFGPSAMHYANCEVHASGESLARLVALTNPQPSWRVLDVATGAGHTAAAFAPHVAEVIASDITEEMLEASARLAAERGLTNMTTANAEAASLPFENDTFDVVTCRLAAHHFPDIPAFLAQAARVLKPAGILAIVDNVAPDATTLPGLPESALRQCAADYNAFETMRDPSHANIPTLAEWCDNIERAGFALNTTEQFAKEMAFEPWAERMRCTVETTAELRRILLSPSPLSTFLQPRTADATLMFSLQEAVMIAGKL